MFEEYLTDSNEIKLTTTIIDGKGKEKIIRFVKHEPESFPGYKVLRSDHPLQY